MVAVFFPDLTTTSWKLFIIAYHYFVVLTVILETSEVKLISIHLSNLFLSNEFGWPIFFNAVFRE